MKIKAAVLRQAGGPYDIEDLELDEPKEKEVLVRCAYTGHYHSDLLNMLGHIKMNMLSCGARKRWSCGTGGASLHWSQEGRSRCRELDGPLRQLQEVQKWHG